MLSNRVINLASLSLLLALAENFIPRPLPFFRLGLANITLLIALAPLSFKEYFLLIILKAFSSSYLSGTLFSPFFLLSLFQSLLSGLLMYASFKLFKDKISLYGISMIGAFFSTLAQLYGASLMLGSGVRTLLPVMLALSFVASIITAYISKRIKYNYDAPLPEVEKTHINKIKTLLLFLIVLLSSTLNSPILLLIAFILAIILTVISKRKFKALNYIFLIALSLFSALLTPRGEVIFRAINFPIARLSLLEGLENGLRLSLMMALSLSLSRLLITGGSVSLILNKFFSMESAFYSAEGSIKEKIQAALNTEYSDNVNKVTNKSSNILLISNLTALIVLNIIELLIF